jgi:soluble lytic murein transglycosylase-like protein
MQTTAATSASAALQSSSPDQIRKVAREFESIFTGIMLKAMRKTVGDNSLIPSSFGEEVYTGMLDDQYSQLLSSKNSTGLAGMIERELNRDNQALQAKSSLLNLAASVPRDLPGTGLASASMASGAVSVVASSPTTGAPSLSRWKTYIDKASSENGVDSSLITAIIAQESGGNPAAVSSKGAKGLMQLMDSTAGAMGVSSSFSPEENISGGTRYLRTLLDRFGGNERLALASYNAGPAAVERYGAVPPYAETRSYVASVLRLKQQYEANAAGGEE